MISVEYPGYSYYKGEPSEEKLYEDSETVLNFVNTVLQVPIGNIMVLGRSLGGGPALHLGSKFNIKLLVLVSTFGSIKNVVKDSMGVLGSMFVKNQFDNVKKIKEVKSRTLIIHGSKDTIVKPKQAEILQDNCGGKCDC